MNVPANLRKLISAEGAANAGLAYPLMTFAVYLMVDKAVQEGFKDGVPVGILCACSHFDAQARFV